MDVPDIPSDVGDLGTAPSGSATPRIPTHDPLPARSTSPPLPPRKNALGLPPTYLSHLRGLLHQWLEQQVSPGAAVTPGEAGPSRLWDDRRLGQIENAIWNGAIVSNKNEGRTRLLDLEWVKWAPGATKRKQLWKESQRTHNREEPIDGKSKRPRSLTHEDSTRGRLSVASGGMTSLTSTPQRIPTRPPSVASTDRSRRDGVKTSFGASPSLREMEMSDPEEKQKDFCTKIACLRGFQRLAIQHKDEWEVLEDDLPLPDFSDKEPPGAFPQAAHLREPSLPSAPPPLPPKTMSSRTAIEEEDLVKPLFCVHFPAPPTAASTSTVHLRRQSSLGSSSMNGDSVGSNGGKWWNGSGSGRRWSGIGLGLGREVEEDVSVEFLEGRFALPSSTTASISPRRRRSSVKKKRRSTLEGAATPSSAATSDDSADDDNDDASSSWSGTQRPGSSLPRSRALSLFLSGASDDIPLSDTSKVVLVGGTVVLRGLRQHAEREAVQKILSVLIYAIGAMMLELELLDAFRIPREADPVRVPPKPIASRQKSSPVPSRSSSPSLRRNTSARERGEKTKGFFQRLGRDTKGMLDNFMGKHKSPERASFSINRENTISSMTTSTTRSSTDVPPETPASSVNNGAPTPVLHQPVDRHIQTLTKLEATRPSSTPGLKIPMPPLLLRVREEEKVRSEKARQEVISESGGLANDVIDGLTRLTSTTSPRDDAAKVRARGYRMGGDVRAGLCALSSGLDEFEGWSRLQRLELLSATGLEQVVEGRQQTTVCERPKALTMTFWDEGDETIADVMEGLLDGEHVCSRPGCDMSQEDHVQWFFHNSQKIGMTFRKVEQGMGENGLDVWIKCTECQQTSEPRKLGQCSSSFSWGKLLEILLYSSILRPLDFCVHASGTPSPLVVQIRSPHTILTIDIKPVTVLDTRLPKLQVGSNVSKRKAGKIGAIGTVDGLIKADKRVALQDDVKADIARITAAIKLKTDAIKRLSASASPACPASLDDAKSTKSVDQGLTPVRTLDVIENELDNVAVALRDAVDRCNPGQMNDVRQEVLANYRRYVSQLDEIQKRLKVKDVPEPEDLPLYFGKKVHALPGSSVLIREDEPSSIIAYTLSSTAYFTELTNTGKALTEETATTEKVGEGWIVEVTRKDTPRDLLSLRTITKKRSDASMAKSDYKLPLTLAPNQPSLELSLEQVTGKSQTTDRLEDIVRSISKATAQDPVLTVKARSPSLSESDNGYSTPRLPPSMNRRTSDSVKAAPPSAFRPTRSVSSTVPNTPVLGASGSLSGNTTPRSVTPLQEGSKEGWSSVTSTFTSSFNNLMKMGSDVGSFRMRGTDRSLSSLIGPLSMMSSMDNALSTTHTDDRPHIQFTYTLPDKLKIGCTIYYATAFDSLRRRCAIDRSVLESLARCESWDAQGGKSKAAFYMTGDKRYIVKELVSKWNVSDTQALLEISPSYFEHLANTHNKATSLAKIVAFTSVRIHDLVTSNKKTMDLMIMENLFYKQNISQTYDLKGIEGRKVPKSMGDGSTLFDSEWIEGQSRAPILLHPHAKRILQEAIYNDTKYLSSQSIMDYSLLLGLDNTRNELVVGLVDAIGSYNLFKTIESRGKLALNRGGEVTIIPPDQYRERFEGALKQYFIACPDKWSKPAKRRTPANDSLPTIL